MFGCGKLDEIKILRYLDGSAKDSEEVEEHLLECGVCLQEITELNRIGVEMDSAVPEPFKKTGVISVLVHEGIFLKLISGAGVLEVLPATRSGDREKHPAVFTMDSIPAVVKIIPVDSGLFWISIKGVPLKGNPVELRKAGDELPFYSKKGSGDEVIVKSLAPGNYELAVGTEKIILQIHTKE